MNPLTEQTKNSQDPWAWVRDLVKAEEQIDETGTVDLQIGFDNEKALQRETQQLLIQIKERMVDTANRFNQLKTSPLGTVKIYGIARTPADFMLFRNGFKMIFAQRNSGSIAIRMNFISPTPFAPTQAGSNPMDAAGATSLMDEHVILAKKGVFGEVLWTFREQAITLDALVKYHFSLFVKESSR